MTTIEQKIVFAISPIGQGDGVPVLMLGVPKGAWEYMSDGKTHTFDLTSIGVPLKLMLYGGANHDEVMKLAEQAVAASGTPLLDERRRDFSIKPKQGDA